MNTNLTEIVFLLDRSGSMAGLEDDTIGGFNSFVKSQLSLPGDLILTTVLFDDKYEILWNGVDPIGKSLTHKEYFVRGSTALLDALGKTILDVGNRLSSRPNEQRPGKVIFVITTDGQENSSKEFTYPKIKELIEHQQSKYRWDFIFLGANIDAVKEAKSIGINANEAFSYKATKDGMASMFCVAESRVSKKRK